MKSRPLLPTPSPMLKQQRGTLYEKRAKSSLALTHSGFAVRPFGAGQSAMSWRR